MMKVIDDIDEMQGICEKLRNQGSRIKLIPTMGALHAGHVSLIENARSDCRVSYQMVSSSSREDSIGILPSSKLTKSSYEVTDNLKQTSVIVSIFVNPIQFNNKEDYDKYSRTMALDTTICKQYKVDYIFAPYSEQMYPDRKPFKCSEEEMCSIVPPSHLSSDLEGKSRPGHFQGMLTVVNKLFNIIKPHEAYFGEKDFQQLILVEKMVHDLNIDILIVPVSTVRDTDMLPLSSRNIRLNKEARQIAPILYRILISAKQELESQSPALRIGLCMKTLLKDIAQRILSIELTNESSSILELDYLELRCAKDLSTVCFNQEILGFDCKRGCGTDHSSGNRCQTFSARLLISIIISGVRLLDNLEIILNVSSGKH